MAVKAEMEDMGQLLSLITWDTLLVALAAVEAAMAVMAETVDMDHILKKRVKLQCIKLLEEAVEDMVGMEGMPDIQEPDTDQVLVTIVV